MCVAKLLADYRRESRKFEYLLGGRKRLKIVILDMNWNYFISLIEGAKDIVFIAE